MFAHLIRIDSNAFLFMAEWYSTVYIYTTTSLSIHLSVDIYIASMIDKDKNGIFFYHSK